MALSITGNSILDFAAIQTASILYLSEAGLLLLKWKESDDPSIRRLSAPPAAAWYAKAAGTHLKMVTGADSPCIKTTGCSIQALSRLAHLLPNFKVDSYLSKPALHSEWKTIAALQLQFCLEYIGENYCTPGELSAVLEGGSCLLQTGGSEEGVRDFLPDLQELYRKITEETDAAKLSTAELASVIRGVSAWYKYNKINQRSEFLTSLALEVLNRKSRSGLFHYGPEGYASAPMGQQFYILDGLLQSYCHILLDHVLEEAFDIFSSLYRIGYKDALELFAFKRRNISYTAFDAGALLSCLDNAARYSTNESGQRDTINKTIDSFLSYLIQSYNQHHEKEIRKLIRWIYLFHEGKARAEDKPCIRTIFPKRIQLMYPHPEINWQRKGIVSQAGILFLCSSLLSLLGEEDADKSDTPEIKLDLTTMETLKMLLEFFINQ